MEENTTRYAELIEEKYLVFLRKIIERFNNATVDDSSEVRSYILAYAQALQRRYNLPTSDIWWNFPRGTDRYRFIYQQLGAHFDTIYFKKWEQVLDYADWIFQTEGAMTIDY